MVQDFATIRSISGINHLPAALKFCACCPRLVQREADAAASLGQGDQCAAGQGPNHLHPQLGQAELARASTSEHFLGREFRTGFQLFLQSILVGEPSQSKKLVRKGTTGGPRTRSKSKKDKVEGVRYAARRGSPC